MSFDFSLPVSADGDGHYAVVSFGRKGTNGGTRRVHARIRRPGNGGLGFELLERTASGGLRPLVPWSLVTQKCSSPIGQDLNHADLSLDASGAWDLTVQDSAGGTCLAVTSSSTGARHAFSFEQQGSLALALMGLSQSGGGEFVYDNVHLEGLAQGEK